MINVSNKDHWLIQQSEISAEKTALIVDGLEITYEELALKSKIAAVYFENNGISEGDHTAVISDHSENFVITLNALWFIGAVPIPLNIRDSHAEQSRKIKYSDSKHLVIFDPESAPAEIRVNLIIFQKKKSHLTPEEFEPKRYDPASISAMLFTSGSTGRSKCVKLTFENMFESVLSADSFIKHSNNDTWLASLPFYHIGGLSIITRSILSGCRNAIPKSVGSSNLNECIKNTTPSLVSLVETMMINILDDFERPWVGLRHIFLGGGPITESQLKKFLSKNWPISIVYGSTETCSMVTLCSSDNLLMNGLSAGKPLKGVNISIDNIINENDGVGNIVVSSGSVAAGYLTSKHNANNNLTYKKFRTNDLGKIDSSGNLRISGRDDDVIISGGENISLNEIREYLLSVFDGCDFIPIPVIDIKWGQSYILVSDCKEFDCEEKMKRIIEHRFGKYKLPDKVIIVDKIPRTEIGKIKRDEIMRNLKFDFL